MHQASPASSTPSFSTEHSMEPMMKPHALTGRQIQSEYFSLGNNQKSETRMTASILKQDPNTQKVQIALFIRTKHSKIVWVIPFIKLQNNTSRTI